MNFDEDDNDLFEDIEDEDLDLDFYDETDGSSGIQDENPDFTVSENTANNHRANIKNSRKTALIAVVTCLVVAVVLLMVYRVITNNDKKLDETNNTDKQEVEKIVDTQKINVNTDQHLGVSKDKWIVIDSKDINQLSGKISAIFTVTAIEHSVKGENGNQIKSILKGNISGLAGEYEIYPQFSLASKCGIGTTFDIEYTKIMEGDMIFVSEIWWD